MPMKKLSLVLLFAVLTFAQTGANQTGAPFTKLKIFLPNYSAQMKQLHEMGADIAGVNLDNHTVDIIATPAQGDYLAKSGFQIQKSMESVSLASPDRAFKNPSQVENLLKNYAAAYPTIAQTFSVGKSLEGRDIWAIKITSNVSAANTGKPRILFNGMHHAREVMSVEIPLDIIDQLLTQYGKDPKVTQWVNTTEIWVLPMFNVDGNNKVWTQQNMWRKNVRGGYGVDINRNYPYAWASCSGSSSSKGAQDYHGPSAASEPETLVMMNLVKTIRPTFDISYHSYSEIVIYPYGCEGQHVPNREVVEGTGQEMAKLLVSDNGRNGYRAGTSSELLYSTDGTDIDWMYHEYQVIPYVIEVNSDGEGFQPGYARWRDITVKRQRGAWQLLLTKLQGPSIAGFASANANVRIERVSGGASFVQDQKANNEGYFRAIVPAGKYSVQVGDANAFTSQKRVVTVTTAPVQL
jgi:carboxypeptidase T